MNIDNGVEVTWMLMSFVTPEEMQRLEERSEAMGVSRKLLMENAGNAVAELLRSKFPTLAGKSCVVVAGTGNNGGDGFVAGRHLSGYGCRVAVILLGYPQDLRTEEASSNWAILEKMTITVKLVVAPDVARLTQVSSVIMEADFVIDAIFGTGIRGRIREPHSSAIDLINASRGLKVAVDVPSGLDPVTGEVHDKAVRADVTVTFHRMKTGLTGRPDLTGVVVVAGIGVPPEAEG